ncbi:MAG: hypothetical protein OXF02_03445 [Simkaniaceae bacterium]|nr:hypothetical protein [Simkaniaceae bacterium]
MVCAVAAWATATIVTGSCCATGCMVGGWQVAWAVAGTSGHSCDDGGYHRGNSGSGLIPYGLFCPWSYMYSIAQVANHFSLGGWMTE